MIIRTKDQRIEFNPIGVNINVGQFNGQHHVYVLPLTEKTFSIFSSEVYADACAVFDALCDAIDAKANLFDLRVFLADRNK